MDVVLDLLVKLFKNPVVIVLGVFFVAICIVLILRLIYSFRFEGEPLMAHLDDEILPNGYFAEELERCGIDLAYKMFKHYHGSDFEPYRRKLLKKIKPLFFIQVTEPGSSWVKVKFSPSFENFVYEHFDSVIVRDFYNVANDYILHMHRDIPIVVHKDSLFEQHLTESLVNEMKLAEDMYYSEIEAAIETKQLEEDENSPENIKKRIIAAYNATIQEIKSHNNRGLNPCKLDVLDDKFLVRILSYKVFTQQKLFDMTSEQAMDFNCQGCYIIYNTFTKKYFVGQSDSMYIRVYTILTSSSVKACVSLQKDIDLGHMVLVKFIRLEDSGYSTINELHRDLILAYDCRQDKGYNK